ncbi:ABC transporter substrate-binding protein [Dactylosporangium fulvum]|uniref:ABC transporter substrate-binding protein n=1 Tax=Dactylosporangium fulvum TaxID=53359 RepID=A0ABY5VXH7_9ACTN|nr:ABC transporter substrate-binding protein [Dactylosporangium fulvum]UWP81972.1 ABC transporter substrate-binding protein [Dactylosporangium fulvum]
MTALVLASALLMTACTGDKNPAPKAPSTIAIGLLVPTSGANAALGQQATLGAKLAIELVNQDFKDLPLPLPLGPGAGLRNGTKLTLIAGNTESAPEKVEQEASRLVSEGAVGLVLADTIDVASPAGRETDLIGVSLVDALSTSDTFAELNRTAHFRIQPSDQQMVSTALGLLFRERATPTQFKRIVTAAGTPTGTLGQQVNLLKNSIEDLSLAAGYEVPSKDKVLPLSGPNAGQSDGKVVKGDAVLAVVTSPAEAAAANELAARLKGTAPVIALGPAVGTFDTLKNGNGSQVLRAVGWSTEFAGRNPIARVVAGMYEQAFHTKLTDVAAAAFTATMVLALAMDQVTDFTPQSVRSAVRQMSLPATQTIMPWNGVRFDGNGYNQLAAGIVEQYLPNGYMVIHPVELAATPTLTL